MEEAEKVRDEVRRLREGEKILVRNYKAYLKSLETEVKGKHKPEYSADGQLNRCWRV